MAHLITRWMAAVGFAALLLAAAPARGQSVDIALDQFGVGNAYRPGDFIGVRLIVTANLAQSANGWVQWEIEDPDGDICAAGRPISLQANTPVPVWLYGRTLPSTNNQTVWTIRVFRVDDGQRTELGATRIQPAAAPGLVQQISPYDGMIGVVGSQDAALGDYTRPGAALIPYASESTSIIIGLEPATDIPDRWFGLRPYEALVWVDGDPNNLGAPAAAAIESWIRRGGHLVIIPPDVNSPWRIGVEGQTDFDDLLPKQRPTRVEGGLDELLPILTKSRRSFASVPVTYYTFADVGRDDEPYRDNGYEPLVALPDGRVVAIQRRFGFGRITILGVDPTNGRIRSQSIPDTDVFWNRIMGRRADTLTAGDVRQMDQDTRLQSVKAELVITPQELVQRWTSRSKRAGQALLLGVLLFFAYWVVAGPGGFAILKYYKQSRHAWMLFVAAAGVFTAITWGSVTIIRQRATEIGHITVLDHIAEPSWADPVETDPPQLQRAVTWYSAFLPDYRPTRLSIDTDNLADQILFAWSPPGASVNRFPNADRYEIDIENAPADFNVPGRATSKLLMADYLGPVPREWGGMIFERTDAPISFDNTRGAEQLLGAIEHGFPGPLRDVRLILITSNQTGDRSYAVDSATGGEHPWVTPNQSHALPNSGYMLSVAGAGDWQPGTALVLSDVVNIGRDRGKINLQTNLLETFTRAYQDRSSLASGAISSAEARDYFEMLGLYQMLTPPQYYRDTNLRGDGGVRFRRAMAREIDLSPWFTRPCLIVTGFLENSPAPVPLTIDGEPAETSDGLTFVRWIYPLPLDDERAFEPVAPADAVPSDADSPVDGGPLSP